MLIIHRPSSTQKSSVAFNVDTPESAVPRIAKIFARVYPRKSRGNEIAADRFKGLFK
jgi:hypothetical protein